MNYKVKYQTILVIFRILLYLLVVSSTGLMLITLFSLIITNLWMWRQNMNIICPPHPFNLFLSSFTNLQFFCREELFIDSAFSELLHFSLIACYLNTCEALLLKLPLDWSSTDVEAAEYISHLFFFFCCPDWLKWLLRNGVAATLFTKGVLPYQCVCCRRLHCLSGQNNAISKKKILNSHCKKVSRIKCVVMLHTDNFAKNLQNALVNLDIMIVLFWCQMLCAYEWEQALPYV